MPIASDRKVLFISADQWRGECLSALEHPCVKTPHLDALAADGVLFREPLFPDLALRAVAHQPADRHVPDEPPQPAQWHAAGLASSPTSRSRRARPATTRPSSATPTPAPIRAAIAPDDPALTTYEGVLPGMTVGLQLPDHMAAWIADLRAKGYDLPGGRHDVYRPVAELSRRRRSAATASRRRSFSAERQRDDVHGRRRS